MNKNKGFIGIGLIIAIVLGIVVVGGGAYYLGKSGSKPVVINPENVLPNIENQNLPVVDNSQQVNVVNPTHSSSITVLSPNGGEVYKDTDKIAIKWKGEGKDRIAIYLRFYSGEWCLIKDVPSTNTNYTFTPFGHNCGDGRGSISGIQKYKITLIVYKNEGMAPEPGTYFAGDYSDNNGSDTGYSIDSSDNYFTINSGTKTITDLQLTDINNGKIINSIKGQVINVTLCNPGDGGAQFDAPQYDSTILNLISHTNVPTDKGNPPVVGGCYGNDVFKFKTLKIGTSKLNITASQPWTGGNKLFPIFSTTIVVK